jgi:acetyltransferase AlgX (SGNH hydrolase-like protein)
MKQRSYLTFLTACFLAIVGTVPLADAAIEMFRDGRSPTIAGLFSHLPSQENLRSLESHLESSSWFPQTLRPWWQRLRFALLADLGEKAVVGRDGWLFYAPDVRYLVEPSPPANRDAKNEEPLSAIIAFRDQLSRKGIHLLVLPVPVKPSIYPDKLTRRIASGGQAFSSHTLELISKLKAAGVEVSNLFETFRRLRERNSLPESEPYYLVRDTHWSGKAVTIAAEEVAEQIRRLGWVDSGSTEYALKPVMVKRRSDVAQMVRAPGIEETYSPEDVLCYQVVQKNDGKPYQDDPHSPVLVLGDSFLRIYQKDAPTTAGFISHLAMKLRRPLASIVNDGGASTLVRQELARRPGLLQDKRLVIWEFVERDIRFGTEGWKEVALP